MKDHPPPPSPAWAQYFIIHIVASCCSGCILKQLHPLKQALLTLRLASK